MVRASGLDATGPTCLRRKSAKLADGKEDKRRGARVEARQTHEQLMGESFRSGVDEKARAHSRHECSQSSDDVSASCESVSSESGDTTYA